MRVEEADVEREEQLDGGRSPGPRFARTEETS